MTRHPFFLLSSKQNAVLNLRMMHAQNDYDNAFLCCFSSSLSCLCLLSFLLLSFIPTAYQSSENEVHSRLARFFTAVIPIRQVLLGLGIDDMWEVRRNEIALMFARILNDVSSRIAARRCRAVPCPPKN